MNPRVTSIFWCSLAVLMLGVRVRAQWVTQSFDLKAGWNAVYLHVDASHAPIGQLLAADPAASIEEIWMWQTPATLQQFVQSPQLPVTGVQWSQWKRVDAAGSPLQTLVPNAAYLVRVRPDVAAYRWDLKGKPVVPRHQWTSSGLNFLGFPAVTSAPPTFEGFLAQSPPDFQQTAEVFRYPGGELGAGNPVRIFALRTTRVRRGEAYWVRAGEVYNRYYGPFEVVVGGAGIITLGDSLSVVSLRLRNMTPSSLTVSLALAASESAPAGQPGVVAPPPLLVRGERNTTNLTFGYTSLPVGSPQNWTLAGHGQPGSEVEVVIGLDRSVLMGNPGDLFAGILRFTDSLGQSRVDVGLSAAIGSTAGLWVGGAAISDVGHYLKTYNRGPDNRPVVGPDGRYVVQALDTSLGAVPATYPLRLIVHNPGSGAAVLFQKIFHGMNTATNPVVTTSESVLAPNLLAQARRVSATHLPWTPRNDGWAFSGNLVIGTNITVSVTNRFDNHSSNPFLHTYHPDHDNLDPRAEREVPQGSESYTIIRDITLSVTPPADDFISRTAASQSLSGRYLETIRILGLARAGNTFDTRTFEVGGPFTLNRISEIPVVTRP